MLGEKYLWGRRPRMDPDGPATVLNGPPRPPNDPDGPRRGILIFNYFYSKICNFYRKIFILH